jgi:hypothetical protein
VFGWSDISEIFAVKEIWIRENRFFSSLYQQSAMTNHRDPHQWSSVAYCELANQARAGAGIL